MTLIFTNRLNRYLGAFLAAIWLFLLQGCASRPPKVRPAPLTLVFSPDGEAKQLGEKFFVIGVNSSVDSDLISGPVDVALDRAKRGSITGLKSFTLNSEVILSEKDEIWAMWRGAKNSDQLVLLADLPLVYLTDQNARRVVVPLDKKRWTKLKKNTLNVTISRDKISLLQSPNPVY